MGANNYIFQSGFKNVYLAKNNKNKNSMSSDRRIVSDDEIIGIFEFYLKRFCIDNKSKCLEIKDNDGNILFEACPKGVMLLDIKKELNK